ncbi:hypothetical protein ACOMHN_059027 [Nucella lapillus]
MLRMPKALEKLKRSYPGLEISVDEKEKTATLMAPKDLMKKALTDVLSFVTGLSELKLPVSRAVAHMYKKKNAAEWIQRTLIDQYELLCDWEAQDDHVILYGQSSDFRCFESMFKSAFLEITMPLTEKEACVLKSPAWISFQEKMQEMKKDESPTPVLLPEETKIIIVDILSSISQTRMALRNFLEENKLEKEVLRISPSQVKFLQLHCKKETQSLQQKARDVGVTVNFTTNSVVTEGPKDCLADTVGRVKELMGRIKEDKMTLKKPEVATYLTGPKGQEFLSQTGTTTGCYITTSSSGAGRDSGDHSNTTEGQVLAEINLNASHQVLIVQGDITQCQVEAIVNAANVHLSHDGGVAAAISKAGSWTIQEESGEIVADGRLMEGEVVVTRAGSLPCFLILHAVAPIWNGGQKGEEELLTRTVKATLKKAETMKLTSVAMPAISCGIFRYPVEEATSTIIDAIFQHFKEAGLTTCLTKLILIYVGADPLRGLLKAAKVRFSQCIDVKGEPKAPSRSGKQGGSSEYSQKALATSTVRVEGLKPETVKEAVQYFFSNKKRNAGGPVKEVDRIGATTALVHFENDKDAASVVKKENHVLDEHRLMVSLHEASVDRPGQQSPPQAVPSSTRFTGPREETRPGTGYQQPGPAHMAGNAQALHSSPGGGGFTGNHYSSSASAQVRHGGPSYGPTFQSRPPHSSPTDSRSFPDSQAGRSPQPQTSVASGVGGHREPQSSGVGGYREPQSSGVGGYREPQSSGVGGYREPQSSGVGGHREPQSSGVGGYREPQSSGVGGYREPQSSGVGGHREPQSSGVGGHREPQSSGVGGHREPQSSGVGAYGEQLSSGVGAHKQSQSAYQHQAGAASSDLINSCNHQPKDKGAVPGSQRNPRLVNISEALDMTTARPQHQVSGQR